MPGHRNTGYIAAAAVAVAALSVGAFTATGVGGSHSTPDTLGVAAATAATAATADSDRSLLRVTDLVAAHRGHGRPRLLHVWKSNADTLYTLRDSSSFSVLAGLLSNGHLRFQEFDRDLGRPFSGPVKGYEWILATNEPSSQVSMAFPTDGNSAQGGAELNG